MKTLELWAFFTPFSSVSTGTYFTTFSSVSTAHCVPPYQFINVEITPALKSTYFVKYFERLLLDRHKMTTENYYHLFEISMVFEWRFTGSVCEFGIRIPGKIASKVNAWISFVEISQKPLAKQLCPQRTLLVVSQIWISIYEGNI